MLPGLMMRRTISWATGPACDRLGEAVLADGDRQCVCPGDWNEARSLTPVVAGSWSWPAVLALVPAVAAAAVAGGVLAGPAVEALDVRCGREEVEVCRKC